MMLETWKRRLGGGDAAILGAVWAELSYVAQWVAQWVVGQQLGLISNLGLWDTHFDETSVKFRTNTTNVK